MWICGRGEIKDYQDKGACREIVLVLKRKHSIGYFKLEGETYNAQIRSADAGLCCSEWEGAF
jgi:hypothetical protein